MELRKKNFSRLVIFKKRRTTNLLLTAMVSILLITVSSVSSFSNMNIKSQDNNQTKEFENTASGETAMCQLPCKYGTGFLPPEMDSSHLTGQEMPEKYLCITPPSSFDWRTSGKVTSVKNQGGCNTCWAFASLGCFESKILINGGGTYNLSEDNLKECDWYHPCCGSSNFYKVASFLSQCGTVLESDDPYQQVHNNNPPCGSSPFQQTLLDWRVISGVIMPSTTVLKNYIYNEGPVYVSLWIGGNPYDKSWNDEFNSYDGSYTMYKPWTGYTDHAVLIVGWDDSLVHAGGTGGWICKNSWGTGWGGTCGYGTEKGYFTIAYNSAAIGKFSSFVDQWGKYNSNGGILYNDEGGWNYDWGYYSTTAWGLCTYWYLNAMKVSRVEFWTTDKTTDVDLYIYDDFDGSTLSNLLWNSENNAFDEAGYHGVAIVPPLKVNAMNKIYVAIKFTNSIYQLPVASDANGPPCGLGWTYTSSNGIKWDDRCDVNVSPKSDVAIRLRVSLNLVVNYPTNPTITGATEGKPGTSYSYNFVTTDADGDKISYYIKWGDSTETDWTPYQNSGTTYSESHTWSAEGTYTIKAKARDIYGFEGNWATFTVTITKNKVLTNPLFLRFVQKYLNEILVLKYLLKL